MKDKFNIRVLCQRCLSEMRLCGYKPIRTKEKCTEECWKCRKQGYEYKIK